MALDQNSKITEPFTQCAGHANINAIAETLGRHIGVVSNGDNSADMRSGTESLADIILRRKEETGKPVVVITGEAHAVGSQVILPQFLMQALRERDPSIKIGHGLERSHNMLEGVIAEKDPDGNALKKAYLEHGHQQAAPLTRHNVMAYCDTHDIPVHTLELNNAISMDGDGYLDPDDPETKALINEVDPELAGQKIPASDETGMDATEMRLRNHGIANNIEKNIENSDIDVYIVPYGLAHLIGTSAHEDIPEFPPEDSLGAILQDRNVETILVYPNVAWAKDILPKNASDAVLDNMIVLDGLGKDVFWQNPNNSDEVNASIGQQEALYLTELNHQSGGTLELADKVQKIATQDSPVPGLEGV